MTPRSPSVPGSLPCIFAAAALATLKLPTRLTSTVVRKLASGIGPSLPRTRPAPRMPAQFTATFRPPRNSWAALTLASTAASSVTSVCQKRALASPSAATASAPLSWFTSNRATLPPAATRWLATARPRPETPPVTMARVSFNCIGISRVRKQGILQGFAAAGGELVRVQAGGEHEPLADGDSQFQQELALFLLLHALGHQVQFQA